MVSWSATLRIEKWEMLKRYPVLLNVTGKPPLQASVCEEVGVTVFLNVRFVAGL